MKDRIKKGNCCVYLLLKFFVQAQDVELPRRFAHPFPLQKLGLVVSVRSNQPSQVLKDFRREKTLVIMFTGMKQVN